MSDHPRPNLRQLSGDVQSRMYDQLGGFEALTDEQVEWLDDHIEQPVLRLICLYEGHEIEDDHCGIRDHRYCVKCGHRATALGLEPEVGIQHEPR